MFYVIERPGNSLSNIPLMGNPKTKELLLFLTALIFSVALMFAFIEFPALLDSVLQEKVSFPGFDQGTDEFAAYKTDLYISALHLRWIGYGSLALVLLLIAIGFATRKSGVAWAGAFVLFLPVFGQFALSMFFLAGLGMLRVLWLPFSDVNISLLQLGDVIYLPHKALLWFFGLFGRQAHPFLTYAYMAAGSFFFVWGVFVWFKTRSGKEKVATKWIYTFSRHPQYLGWIIWSYGLMLFSAGINDMKKSWSIPSSLPWLLATMIIIGICFMEEIKMQEENEEAYMLYRQKAPFLFPVPTWLGRIIKFPMLLAIGKGYPEKPGEAIRVVLLYTALLVLPSFLWVDFTPQKTQPMAVQEYFAHHPAAIDSLILEIKKPQDRRQLYLHFERLRAIGQPAASALIGLLEDTNPDVREFAAYALGQLKAEQAAAPLSILLQDTELRPSKAAAEALGQIGSEKAVAPLLNALADSPNPGLRHSIHMALGNTGSPEAWEALVKGLEDEVWYARRSALQALNKIAPQRSAPFLIWALEDEHVALRREAVFLILQQKPPEAIDALKTAIDDEDFETRFYARQALRMIEEGV